MRPDDPKPALNRPAAPYPPPPPPTPDPEQLPYDSELESRWTDIDLDDQRRLYAQIEYIRARHFGRRPLV